MAGIIRYQDLALRRSGDDLVVEVGNGERVTLGEWYADPQHQMVQTMQVIAEAMQGYSQAGGNPLLDDKVEWFDFGALVAEFDQARQANRNLSRWSMMSELLDADLGGSDALGGDLALSVRKSRKPRRNRLAGRAGGAGIGRVRQRGADAAAAGRDHGRHTEARLTRRRVFLRRPR